MIGRVHPALCPSSRAQHVMAMILPIVVLWPVERFLCPLMVPRVLCVHDGFQAALRVNATNPAIARPPETRLLARPATCVVGDQFSPWIARWYLSPAPARTFTR